MQLHMMKSKIHRARVTEADLEYEGSLTVDSELMEAAKMIPHEMVKVYNVNNGDRFETYVIPGEPGSGTICLNGAAARKGQRDDLLIIVTSCWLDQAQAQKHQPTVVLVGEGNRIKSMPDKDAVHLQAAL